LKNNCCSPGDLWLFPCQAEGNSLYLYAPEEMNHKELNTQEPVATFEFPQQSLRRLCIADFMHLRNPVRWVFPMQAVTVGDIATEEAQSYLQHTSIATTSISTVGGADCGAESVHARIRRVGVCW